MNIFYLHPDPLVCAQQHCDKHAVKMCTEYAQLLSTCHRVVDGTLWHGRTINGRKIARYWLENKEMNSLLYKASHINHPSNVWVRKSAANYQWLFDLWTALCGEYKYRYGRVHESFRKLEYHLMIPPENISNDNFTQPTPAMNNYPHCIVEGDSITSYRNFYWEDKRSFAKWTKRKVPEWWLQKHVEWEKTK